MTTCVEKIVPVVQAEDRFRNVDRGVKQLVKSTQQQVDKSKKRSWTDHNDSTIENSFSWSDVVDPLSSSSRLRYIRSIPGCLCTEPHRCTSSAQGTKVFELEGYPSGLYVFMNAICSEGQLIWARRALEVYSTAEHTNLSNLSKLQENGDKDMRDANETTNQLWENSIRAKDNFASFNKLRWSCLGYHYGESVPFLSLFASE